MDGMVLGLLIAYAIFMAPFFIAGYLTPYKWWTYLILGLAAAFLAYQGVLATRQLCTDSLMVLAMPEPSDTKFCQLLALVGGVALRHLTPLFGTYLDSRAGRVGMGVLVFPFLVFYSFRIIHYAESLFGVYSCAG